MPAARQSRLLCGPEVISRTQATTKARRGLIPRTRQRAVPCGRRLFLPHGLFPGQNAGELVGVLPEVGLPQVCGEAVSARLMSHCGSPGGVRVTGNRYEVGN